MFIYLIGKGRRRKREARKEGREINQTVQKQTSKIRKHVTLCSSPTTLSPPTTQSQTNPSLLSLIILLHS
jgi:hypothetical protein